MICAPLRWRSSGPTALTLPALPTGMKAGVSTAPQRVCSLPRRAPVRASWWMSSKRTNPKVSEAFIGAPLIRDQHRVAVREEAVAELHGLGVSAEHPLPPEEGAHQDEKGRLGQVEIRQQRIDLVETKAGLNEKRRFPRARSKEPGVFGRRFERADYGRPDRHDAPAGLLRIIHRAYRGLRNEELFRVHVVALDLAVSDGKEGARPNVQS